MNNEEDEGEMPGTLPAGDTGLGTLGGCPGGESSGGICTPFNNVHRSAWMTAYGVTGRLTIDRLLLPGTHNSGMDKEASYNSSPDTCQDVSPHKQLMIGIRVLDLRVRFYDHHPEGDPRRFALVHDLDSGRTVRNDILVALTNFRWHSPPLGDPQKEIVVLDFHVFERFTDAAHRELCELLNCFLGAVNVPVWWRALTVGQIRAMAEQRSVVIAYRDDRRDSEFWPGVNQRWIGEYVVSSDRLKRFMDQVADENKPAGELRSIQCAKYVQTFPVPVPDDISDSIRQWFYADDANSYIMKFFIINTDWSLRQRLIDNCIHACGLRNKATAEPLDYSIDNGEDVTIRGGNHVTTVRVYDGHWTARLHLPVGNPEGSTLVIKHDAAWETQLIMTPSDYPADDLVLIKGDRLALHYTSGRWRVLAQKHRSTIYDQVIPEPKLYEKVMGYEVLDAQFVLRLTLPVDIKDKSIIQVTSSAIRNSIIEGSSMEDGQAVTISYRFNGVFVYSADNKKWVFDGGVPGVPDIPAPQLSIENSHTPYAVLGWNATPKAVKYRVFRFTTRIAEIEGTRFEESHSGYATYRVRAVTGTGELSPFSNTVYSYGGDPDKTSV